MNVKHLDHLNMSVSDLSASIDWYGRVFGFEPVENGVYDGAPWSILKSGEAMLCLYEHPDFQAPDNDSNAHGMNHFGLRITDESRWLATIESQGIDVRYGGAVRWPHSTAWYVTDPTGYEIEVALWDDDRIRFHAM